VTKNFVIFDTCAQPEYYDDVHKILALPAGHTVTYDYRSSQVTDEVQNDLDDFNPSENHQVVLVYVQDPGYVKGTGVNSGEPLPNTCIQLITRLATIEKVRPLANEDGTRYFIDLKLASYPADREGAHVRRILQPLFASGDVPFRKYIVRSRDTSINDLFNANGSQERAFSSVIDQLSTDESQFMMDTFWRITRVRARSKPMIPFLGYDTVETEPHSTEIVGDRTQSYFELVDQSTLLIDLQFHRAKDMDSINYRSRYVAIESSPKSPIEIPLSRFRSRAFGQETVAVRVPSTTSLSDQDFLFQIATENHEKDDQKDYVYGPQLTLAAKYKKPLGRVCVSLTMIFLASSLFAIAAFSSSTSTAPLTEGFLVPLPCRIAAILTGVICTVYGFYLWSDDIALDKIRRT